MVDRSPDRDAPSCRAAATLALLGFAVVYALIHGLGWRGFVYLPTERAWALAAGDGVIGMGYYGMQVIAATAAACAYAVARLTPVRRLLSGAVQRALSVATMVAVPLVLVYLAVSELLAWA